MNRTKVRKVTSVSFCFFVTMILLLGVFVWSANTGSIRVTPMQLFKGLFIAFDPDVATVYDLRFPRIIISMFVGAALAVSGVLFQAVLKNPLTDPGIIGISGGAGFAAVLFTALCPALYAMTPAAAFAGGIAAFFIVYTLSWKGGLSPLRIILVGVAVSTLFSGLSSAFNSMSGGNLSGVASIVEGNISMRTWTDVQIVCDYIPVILLIAWLFAGKCNLMMLDDKTAKGIGVNVDRLRIVISMMAVLLASVSTSVVGIVSFVGLLVPHIARIFVGSNHRVLIPYSVILGALVFLTADTLGRSIMPPYEMNASVVMAVVGGPFFIILLKGKKGEIV